MILYPLFADLRGRPVLVVGGGAVARRKAARLLAAGAVVTVGAPTVCVELAEWASAGRIVWRIGEFHPDWLDGHWLAVAATGVLGVNRAVAEAGQERRVFVNVVDDAGLSSFQVPAVVDRAPVQIAISSGGTAPLLTRALRERIERIVDHAIGPLAQMLDRFRSRTRMRFPDTAARRRFYARIIHGPVAAFVRNGKVAEAENAFKRALATPTGPADGLVMLVGAGPGDPGLLTLRALRALGEADVILYDRLVAQDVLDMARRDALFIDVGKREGAADAGQARIHALMLAHARAGKCVVRLKGGDPFMFGRGGEEMEFLRAHAIDYEVVPGITAAVACAAYAGVPLTHRDHAQSVRFVTAQCRDSLAAPDWRAFTGERETLAIYMGAGQLVVLRDRLLAHGYAASTPFALVENGTRPQQRVVVGTLAELSAQAQRHGVGAPALLIVGAVAAFAKTLHWYGAPPLHPAPAFVPEAMHDAA